MERPRMGRKIKRKDEKNMDELLFTIIKLLVIVVITVVMRYGIPLLKSLIENTKLNEAVKWAKWAVDSAEQTIKKGGSGAEKKAIVTQFLKEILIEKNIALSDAQLDALIEAAVFAIDSNKEGA